MSDKYKFQPTGNAALDAKLAEAYADANERYQAIKAWEAQELSRIHISVLEQEADLESDLIDRLVKAKMKVYEDLQDDIHNA